MTTSEFSPCLTLLPIIDPLVLLYSLQLYDAVDATAVALLPLSEEYQMDILKKQCITELKKLSKPRLEYVAIAIQYDDINFREAAMASCARKLSMRDLDNQMCSKENRQQITDDVILQLVK